MSKKNLEAVGETKDRTATSIKPLKTCCSPVLRFTHRLWVAFDNTHLKHAYAHFPLFPPPFPVFLRVLLNTVRLFLLRRRKLLRKVCDALILVLT